MIANHSLVLVYINQYQEEEEEEKVESKRNEI